MEYAPTHQQFVTEKFGYELTFAREPNGATYFCLAEATDDGWDYGCYRNPVNVIYVYCLQFRVVLELLLLAWLYRRWNRILEHKCKICRKPLKHYGLLNIVRFKECHHYGCEKCMGAWLHVCKAHCEEDGWENNTYATVCGVCKKASLYDSSTTFPTKTPLWDIFTIFAYVSIMDICFGFVFINFSLMPHWVMELVILREKSQEELHPIAWEVLVIIVRIIFLNGFRPLFTRTFTTHLFYTMALGKFMILAQFAHDKRGIFDEHPKLKFCVSSKGLAKICLSLIIIKWIILMYNLGSDAADRISKYGGHIH